MQDLLRLMSMVAVNTMAIALLGELADTYLLAFFLGFGSSIGLILLWAKQDLAEL